MKKHFLITVFVCVLSFTLTQSIYASGSAPEGKKGFIVLAHGMAANENVLSIFGVDVIPYFYQIQDWLEDEGWIVYQSGNAVSSWNGAVHKGKQFSKWFYTELLPQIDAEWGDDFDMSLLKVHIIGHSHGTMYTRYAITNGSGDGVDANEDGDYNDEGDIPPATSGGYAPLAPYVVSHTSLCGPHRGSTTCDILDNNQDNIPKIIADVLAHLDFYDDEDATIVADEIDEVVDFMEDILSYVGLDLNLMTILSGVVSFLDILDEQQDISISDNAFNLSTYGANYIFNPNVPNVAGVNYQSWASAIQGESTVYGFPLEIPLFYYPPVKHNWLRGINLVFNPTWGYMLDGSSGHKIANTQNVAIKYGGSALDITNGTVTSGGHTIALSDLMSGPNDGLVDEQSAKWGTYRGLIDGNDIFDVLLMTSNKGGVDHFQLTNNLLGNTPGFDPEDFWIETLLPEIQDYEDNRTDI
jgi:triacylglycerol lipase